jgi:hypothetical protein
MLPLRSVINNHYTQRLLNQVPINNIISFWEAYRVNIRFRFTREESFGFWSKVPNLSHVCSMLALPSLLDARLDAKGGCVSAEAWGRGN